MAKATKSLKGGRNVRHKDPARDDGFWDRPVLIDLMADLLLVAGGFLLLWAAVAAVQRLPVFPLRQLIVTSRLDQVPRAQLEHTARTVLAGNFFTVDLDAVKSAFERLPWVRNVDVRRRWPDAIELALEEHKAVARWVPKEGEPRLVNEHGEVFLAGTSASLPGFAGPEGSAPRVLSRFAEFNSSLAVIDRHLVSVHLSSREAWRLRLDDGVLLELGRDQPKHPLSERLTRFTETYSAARERLQASIGTVDMRYPNGFALRTGGTDGNTEMSRSL